MDFTMPCLDRYYFNTEGECFLKSGIEVNRCIGDYYKLIDDKGDYEIITIQEIMQYGKNLYPDMRTVTMSILYPVRKSKANINGDNNKRTDKVPTRKVSAKTAASIGNVPARATMGAARRKDKPRKKKETGTV